MHKIELGKSLEVLVKNSSILKFRTSFARSLIKGLDGSLAYHLETLLCDSFSDSIEESHL